MRGAFGKPLGTVARVDIGQPLISIRTYDKHKASVIEALRRSKFKFPGRQKVSWISSAPVLLPYRRLIFETFLGRAILRTNMKRLGDNI